MLLLSGFSLGVCAVLILIIARDFFHLAVGKAFIAVLVAGSCFLFENQLPDPLKNIAASISTMVPALFWVLCQQAFSHRPNVFSPMGVVALISFIAPAIYRFSPDSAHAMEHYRLILWTLPSYTEYLLVISGIWVVVSNWNDDLVESRRRIRGVFLCMAAVAIFLVIIPMNTGISGIWLPYSSVCLISLFCAYFFLKGNKGVLFGEDIKEKPEPELITISPEQVALDLLMKQGFYRTEHLTLKALASKLELPEYKTRALINQELGYRNFNDFINQLRIEEAAQHLLEQPDCPVLNISLDVGYRTLSSFNRAFKDIKKMSPSEYRQMQLEG